jgi:hypothetical protein
MTVLNMLSEASETPVDHGWAVDPKTVPPHEFLFPPCYCNKKLSSVAWVRERTLPTEWPLLVGEVIANFCG